MLFSTFSFSTCYFIFRRVFPFTSSRAASTASGPDERGLSRLPSERKRFQYLEVSPLPTSHFQRSLPSLPIPKLDRTLERYLRTLSAILPPDQVARTSALAQDFLKSIYFTVQNSCLQLHIFSYFFPATGPNLQSILKRSVEKGSSYISPIWYIFHLLSISCTFSTGSFQQVRNVSRISEIATSEPQPVYRFRGRPGCATERSGAHPPAPLQLVVVNELVSHT